MLESIDSLESKDVDQTSASIFQITKKSRAKKAFISFKNLFKRNQHKLNSTSKQAEKISIEELSGQGLTELIQSLVLDIDQKTPKFLKYLTDSCPSCMDLPDDCKYIDYSIFDVNNAYKKLIVYPEYIQRDVINDLEKINPELGYHLRQRLMEV